MKNKHGNHPVAAHQHTFNPHPHAHPYLNHVNHHPNIYPQRTPEMVANNTYYTKGIRAPTKISVGPNVQKAPTTISALPLIGGVQDGGGIGGQFHRPSQNSSDVASHMNRAPTTISVPPVRSQHGAGIETEMDFNFSVSQY